MSLLLKNNINQIKNLSNEKSSSIELDVNNYKSTKKRLALLVANQSYKSSPLTNPINDIRLISNTLKNKGLKFYSRKPRL